MENKSKPNLRGYGIVFTTAGLGCVAVSAALALGWTGSPPKIAIDAPSQIDMTALGVGRASVRERGVGGGLVSGRWGDRRI